MAQADTKLGLKEKVLYYILRCIILRSSFGALSVIPSGLIFLYLVAHSDETFNNSMKSSNHSSTSEIPALRETFGDDYLLYRNYEKDFEKPRVFMVSIINQTSIHDNGKYFGHQYFTGAKICSSLILYIFTHGLDRITKDEHFTYSLNAESCIIGENEYPLSYGQQGIFACCVDKEPSIGSSISISVAENVFRIFPDNSDLKEKIMRDLQHNKLDSGKLRVPSGVVWKGQADRLQSDEKYEICAVTVEKNFPELIDPWIQYHRRIGFDRFYIYDNDNRENLTEKVKTNDDVEVIYWPWPRTNILAQSHFLLHSRSRCHWVSIFDVDEYYFFRTEGNWGTSINQGNGHLRNLLRTALTLNYSQVTVGEIRMGSSGYVRQSKLPPPETFIHRHHRYFGNAPKSFVYASDSIPNSNVHTVELSRNKSTVEICLNMEENADKSSIGLIHFEKRSWEEHIKKVRGGRGSHRTFVWKASRNLHVDKPSKKHVEFQEEFLFEHFRNLWRKVSIQNEPGVVTLPKEREIYYDFAKKSSAAR